VAEERDDNAACRRCNTSKAGDASLSLFSLNNTKKPHHYLSKGADHM
jgi:hypothetical protein